MHITKVGTVNFRALAQSAQPRAVQALGAPRAMPRMLPSFVKKASTRAARARARIPHVARATGITGNVQGVKGFNGIDHTANEANFGFDISPPDHGLAVGTSSAGNIIIQSLNLSLQAFTRSGRPLTAPIGANTFMGLGPCTSAGFPVNCPSDPRVYWDPQTRHWFLTDLTFANSPLGRQFIAVSRTTNGLGNYTIFSLPTGAGFIDPSDCPCTGDFDMIGADKNGFYVEVQEFGQTSYHGAVLFAVSKGGLITAANGGRRHDLPLHSADELGPIRRLPPRAGVHDAGFTVAEHGVLHRIRRQPEQQHVAGGLGAAAHRHAERPVPDAAAAGRDGRVHRGLQHPAASAPRRLGRSRSATPSARSLRSH